MNKIQEDKELFKILSYESTSKMIWKFDEERNQYFNGHIFLRNVSNQKITSVRNEDGNIFDIGDIITPLTGLNKGKSFKIIGFRYKNDKSMICAMTNHHKYGIGINLIEHFVEKEEFISSIEETLLEKAKRLYPVGTKYKSASYTGDYAFTVTSLNFTERAENMIWGENGKGCLFLDGKWAEIIK